MDPHRTRKPCSAGPAADAAERIAAADDRAERVAIRSLVGILAAQALALSTAASPRRSPDRAVQSQPVCCPSLTSRCARTRRSLWNRCEQHERGPAAADRYTDYNTLARDGHYSR